MDVSVLIPTYNQAEYVGETLDSVLSQTRPPDQIVVADDASKDGTTDIVAEYAANYPEKIDLICRDENLGPAGNQRAALENGVTGDAVSLLAGDDRWRPEKLERELALFKNPDVGVVYSNFATIDENGNQRSVWTDAPVPEGDVLEECLLRRWPKNALYRCPLLDTDLVKKSGLYDSELSIFEDWDLKIRLAALTQTQYCPEVLTEYRQVDDGISNSTDWVKRVQAIRRIFAKNRSLLADRSFADRERVERQMTTLLLRYEALAQAEAGERLGAIQRYASFLAQNPGGITNYKLHLRLLREL